MFSYNLFALVCVLHGSFFGGCLDQCHLICPQKSSCLGREVGISWSRGLFQKLNYRRRKREMPWSYQLMCRSRSREHTKKWKHKHCLMFTSWPVKHNVRWMGCYGYGWMDTLHHSFIDRYRSNALGIPSYKPHPPACLPQQTRSHGTRLR